MWCIRTHFRNKALKLWWWWIKEVTSTSRKCYKISLHMHELYVLLDLEHSFSRALFYAKMYIHRKGPIWLKLRRKNETSKMFIINFFIQHLVVSDYSSEYFFLLNSLFSLLSFASFTRYSFFLCSSTFVEKCQKKLSLKCVESIT